MTPNRIVTLFSPIFAGVAGWVVQLVARYFPGHPTLDRAELTAIFIAGAAVAIGALITWLHGWSKWEQAQALLGLNDPVTIPPVKAQADTPVPPAGE